MVIFDQNVHNASIVYLNKGIQFKPNQDKQQFNQPVETKSVFQHHFGDFLTASFPAWDGVFLYERKAWGVYMSLYIISPRSKFY